MSFRTVVIVVSLAAGRSLALDQLLLPLPPLLGVLQVLLPLVPGPELAHLDLTGSVIISGTSSTSLLCDLFLSLS